jgi:hypothetical protein
MLNLPGFKVIIVPTKQGQLGNRLFHLIKIYAYCIKHNYTLLYPSLYQYKDFLTIDNHGGKLIIGYCNVYKAINLIYRLLVKINFYRSFFHEIIELKKVSEKHFLKGCMPKGLFGEKIVFLSGWGFDPCYLHLDYRNILLPLFHFDNTITTIADSIIKKLRTQNDVLIAFHIRRGDYINFEEGKYYYSFDQYSDFINQTTQIFPDRKICFIVASNEQCDTKLNLKEKTNCFFSNESAPVDLLLLSQCDYLIGPPSTFSLWASYYGNVPQILIRSGSQMIKTEDFILYFDRHR